MIRFHPSLLFHSKSESFKQYTCNSQVGPVFFDLPNRYQPNVIVPGTDRVPALGCGSFGVVIKCRDTVKNEDVAVKKIISPFQNEIFARRAYREFAFMRHLPEHRNVIKLRDVFTTAATVEEFNNYYVVMDLMDFDLLRFWQGVPVKEVPHIDLSYLLYQMLCAVNHLHRLGIIHRDLKPANLAVKQNGFHVKLLDFGLARSFLATVKMTSCVYTRWYRAPEVVLDVEYSTKADIWAIGCIFAEILLGEVYLRGRNDFDQWHKIAERLPTDTFLARVQSRAADHVRLLRSPVHTVVPFNVQFPESIFPPDDPENPKIFCADQARDLLSRLLVVDPDERLSAEQALEHPYVSIWYDSAEISAELPPFVVDPEPQESTMYHWKNLLWQEIQNYRIAKK